MNSKTARRRVLILGARAPVALELARQFAAHGHTVFAADSVRFTMCSGSRAVRKNIVLPPPAQDLAGFAAAIRAAISRHSIDFVLPMCEEVFHLSRIRESLPAQVTAFVMGIGTLRRLHDKFAFNRRIAELGFAVPATDSIATSDDVSRVVREIEAGAERVLKPAFSRFADRTLIRPRDGERVRRALADVSPAAPWVSQQFIAGRQICTYSVAREGRLMAHSDYATSFTAGQGASIFFAPIFHAAARRFCEAVIAAENFTGQIAFDFIETEAGEIFPIECNPRATSGAHLFAASDGLWRAFFGGDESAGVIVPKPRRKAQVAMGMLMFLPTQMTRASAMSRWVGTFFSTPDVLFRWDDPWPAVAQFFTVGTFLLRAAWHGRGVLGTTTADIEWNGE